MISRRNAALLTAGALALGLVIGGAGTIFAREPTTSSTIPAACLEYMEQHGATMGGSSGAMMGGSGMMGGSDMMGGSSGMMGGSSGMSDWMAQHHGATAPGSTR